jgi:hypothetical protein
MVRAETEVPEVRRKTRSRSGVRAGGVGLRDLMLRRGLMCLEYETGWWLDRAWPQLVRCALANTCALFLKVRRRKENGVSPRRGPRTSWRTGWNPMKSGGPMDRSPDETGVQMERSRVRLC